MTREEAVNIMSQMIKDEEGFLSDNTVEAHKMAIKALEQEPCEDAISRSDMLDAIGHGTTYTSEELQRIIKGLPPVNPQACGDLISRKAILEEFENDQYHLEFCKEHHIERSISMEMVRIRLHDLPSVNPQPCEDTISRQTVLDIVDSYSESQSNVEDVTQDIISDIMALPSVNPQPKTGHWIEIAQYPDGKHKIECSECGGHIFDRGHANSFNVKNKYKYCPNCGTKMVEPQESEE